MSECCDKIKKELDKIRDEKKNKSSVEKVYSCIIHPEVQKERPGMCPECGMNLV